eukprot:g10581.t1
MGRLEAHHKGALDKLREKNRLEKLKSEDEVYEAERKRLRDWLDEQRKRKETEQALQEQMEYFEFQRGNWGPHPRNRPATHILNISTAYLNHDQDFGTERLSPFLLNAWANELNYLEEDRRELLYGKSGFVNRGFPVEGPVPLYGAWEHAKKLTQHEKLRLEEAKQDLHQRLTAIDQLRKLRANPYDFEDEQALQGCWKSVSTLLAGPWADPIPPEEVEGKAEWIFPYFGIGQKWDDSLGRWAKIRPIANEKARNRLRSPISERMTLPGTDVIVDMVLYSANPSLGESMMQSKNDITSSILQNRKKKGGGKMTWRDLYMDSIREMLAIAGIAVAPEKCEVAPMGEPLEMLGIIFHVYEDRIEVHLSNKKIRMISGKIDKKQLPENLRRASILVYELIAIKIAQVVFADEYAEASVVQHCDNAGAVYGLVKGKQKKTGNKYSGVLPHFRLEIQEHLKEDPKRPRAENIVPRAVSSKWPLTDAQIIFVWPEESAHLGSEKGLPVRNSKWRAWMLYTLANLKETLFDPNSIKTKEQCQALRDGHPNVLWAQLQLFGQWLYEKEIQTPKACVALVAQRLRSLNALERFNPQSGHLQTLTFKALETYGERFEPCRAMPPDTAKVNRLSRREQVLFTIWMATGLRKESMASIRNDLIQLVTPEKKFMQAIIPAIKSVPVPGETFSVYFPAKLYSEGIFPVEPLELDKIAMTLGTTSHGVRRALAIYLRRRAAEVGATPGTREYAIFKKRVCDSFAWTQNSLMWEGVYSLDVIKYVNTTFMVHPDVDAWCKKKFVVAQADAADPFLVELLEQTKSNVNDLDHLLITTYYEALGLMIGAAKTFAERERYVEQLMTIFNEIWAISVRALHIDQGASLCEDLDTLKKISLFLRLNERVAGTVGLAYTKQLRLIYQPSLQLYQLFSNYVSQRTQQANLAIALKSANVKQMRTAKRATLRLVTTFLKRCLGKDSLLAAGAANANSASGSSAGGGGNAAGSSSFAALDQEQLPAGIDSVAALEQEIAGFIVPPLLLPVLQDYERSPPEARDAEVLDLLAALITHLSKPISSEVPRIFEMIVEPTLRMLEVDLQNYPDHRVKLFSSLFAAINRDCFQALFFLGDDKLRLYINSLLWGMKHEHPVVSPTALGILREFLQSVLKLLPPQATKPFFTEYYAEILKGLLKIMTDTMHTSGLRAQLEVLLELIRGSCDEYGAANGLTPAVAANDGSAPSTNAFGVSQQQTMVILATFFQETYPDTLAKAQIETFVLGMFNSCQNANEFAAHVTDFLKELLRERVTEWRAYYVSYEILKDYISEMIRDASYHERFLHELGNNVLRFMRFYERQEKRALDVAAGIVLVVAGGGAEPGSSADVAVPGRKGKKSGGMLTAA